ncbi:MAG: RnfABCDGE type electron transport complex subunit G [Bacteroidales bacterium]|jgi:electron transport complex protein RnfG|nr:RnfABCDGE type electron transport complex subunit G [Bacteroidales bacterium]
MAKKESTFLNMTLTLFIITAVAAVALAYVYKLTETPISEAKAKKLQTAISVVVPGAENGEITIDTVPSPDGSGNLEFYTIKVNGEIIGTAVKSFTNSGFGGHMAVMVGFDQDGKIIDSNVLEHQETPGLGDKTNKSVSSWNDQFKGKDPQNENIKVKKDGGVIDAITAATISSRAYSDAVQRAHSAFMVHNEKMNKEDVNTGGTISNTESAVTN